MTEIKLSAIEGIIDGDIKISQKYSAKALKSFRIIMGVWAERL